MSHAFLNRRCLSMHDLATLTSLRPTRIRTYSQRGMFRPQRKVNAGNPHGRPSYTGRDVLRLQLIAAVTEFGVYRDAPVFAELLRNLDSAIDGFTAGVPAEGSPEVLDLAEKPWIALRVDLAELVATGCRKIAEHLDGRTV